MKRIGFVIGFLVFLTSIICCERNNDVSPVPKIQYKSFFLKDTVDALGNTVKLGILTFDFTDGDGDIGLPEPSENDPPELQHNLFLNGYYTNSESEIVAMPQTDPNSALKFRIPDFSDQVLGEPYEGTIRVEASFFEIAYPAILYEFYVTDRAGNSSNIETTETIQIP